MDFKAFWKLLGEFQDAVRALLIFGTHVHVGTGEDDEFRRASQGVVEDLERSQSEATKSLQGIDDETLRKLAEKLGVKDAEKKKRDDLIVEIINEAKKKGLLDEIKVEAEQSAKSTNTEA
ncbi:MAG TPA: hypothetical protein EYP33_04160 [Pyrodictium sp.]|nr:hypothetical protein [Pyrodictium sp.]